MKYEVKPTKIFQKDLKRVQRRGYNISLLTQVIKALADGRELPPKNANHALSGVFSGCRECHVMQKQRGVTEQLKESDQMRWVQEMNNIKDSVKEIILNDLIYS